LQAYEQLAIHFEHRARQLHRAASLAHKALAELQRARELGTIAPSAYRQRRACFEQRLVRLERKAGRSLLDTSLSNRGRLPVNLIGKDERGVPCPNQTALQPKLRESRSRRTTP
jgi:hypothetical protein